MGTANIPDPLFTNATAVSDFLLEETRRAFELRDVELFCYRFLLPQLMGTFDGQRRITTREELEGIYQRTAAYFDTYGVLDMRRRTVEAQFETPTRVRATYHSQHLTKGPSLSDAVVGTSTLHLIDGIWLVGSSEYATKSVVLSQVLRPAPKTG